MQLQAYDRNGINNGLTNGLHKLHRKHSSVVQRAVSKLSRFKPNKGKLVGKMNCSKSGELGDNIELGSGQQKSWDNMEYSERQNTVKTLDLFRYAQMRELLAIIFGIVFMIYAASWQPISVFILAIMASLMGRYSKQVDWLIQLNSTSVGGGDSSNNRNNHELILSRYSRPLLHLSRHSNLTIAGQPILSGLNPALSSGSVTPESPFNDAYKEYDFLDSLHSFVMPLFELAGSSTNDIDEANHIKSAVRDILEHESNQFLRKSFEINGSAFLLALTQLFAFFLGISLITWAAKQQAARIKILYFNSCLHQEVTWFEAIDSASGSGSSLNGLVEKYEDGIGMKLALLCYFLGHVGLFALTAFYQMFSLAAFCMPFVLAVGLIIAYLSDRQAVAIGQHALFAKRSLQLAEEIIAAIRTVFAFNGQQKEITRYSLSFEPVYRKSLIKHLYTALNTSLSKFSIFACFAAYCFYAKHLFPPYSESANSKNKATILAVMRGAEVSIVNILISIPFMEALQQSKGSIARIYVAIERRSKINASSGRGLRLDKLANKGAGQQNNGYNNAAPAAWQPSISFRMVQFGYADRSGPTRRRSTLPFLNLPACPATDSCQAAIGAHRRPSQAGLAIGPGAGPNSQGARRRRSLIDELADEVALEAPVGQAPAGSAPSGQQRATRRQSGLILRAPGHELDRPGQTASRRVLNHFNLEIRAGQSVALVGPSGSGKSTVLALVQRLYDITGGQLLIGQHNIKDLSVAWLRNQIGVVAQEPRLFDMSIAENIMLGLASDDVHLAGLASERGLAEVALVAAAGRPQERPGAGLAHVMQQVVEAARAASAHEFISRLPNGYATRVGAGGVQLSGGQKQRIAIARALIRRPKILLLDECTAALDSESEAQVQEALRAASSADRTTLIVAHRLETIKHVDLIVVMSQGQVVECGSHKELMAMSSASDGAAIYRQMYEEQLRLAAGDSGSQPAASRATAQRARPAAQIKGAAAGGGLATLAGFGANQQDQIMVNNNNANDASVYDDVDKQGDNADGANYEHDEHADDDALSSISTTTSTSTSSSGSIARPSAWQLWQFIEMPKWTALVAVLVCLLAGLILPLNLIAHSYLFSVFAYNELEQIGEYLHVFGLLILSFSTFVFIVSFLQVLLPGYVGEKLSARLSVKTLDSLLQKPMFYFDMESNSAGSLCDRFNSYISNLQSIAGTRVATMLEAVSTLMAGAFFGLGRNLSLSLFCLSFALLVLITTIIESRIIYKESSLQRKYDAQLAHLMADALSNIKTIASLNQEHFFVARFRSIVRQRQIGLGNLWACLRNFLISLKFVMPALSWSASMYYGCQLLASGRIDLQTIFM